MNQIDHLLSPVRVVGMKPSEQSFIMSVLDENLQYSLERLFKFGAAAHHLLKTAVARNPGTFSLDEILILDPEKFNTNNVLSPPHTLADIFDSIIFTNKPLTAYNPEWRFYSKTQTAIVELPPTSQRSIKNVLFALKGVSWYLNQIDEFWNSGHEFTGQTNRDYIANLLAIQLQCMTSIGHLKRSLSSSSTALLVRLANIHNPVDVHLHRLSFTWPEKQVDIPLAGAFLLSQHSYYYGGAPNNCVLYVPGIGLQQFDSIESAKVHLAASPNRETLERFFICIAKSQHTTLANLAKTSSLDENFVALHPIKTHRNFFKNRIQELIDKDKQDLIYTWSRAHLSTRTLTEPQRYIPWYSTSKKQFQFFDATLWKETATPDDSQQETPPPKKKNKTSSSLRSIRLYIFLHKKLEEEGHTLVSLEKRLFSWLIREIESFTPREVELIPITTDDASKLNELDYTSGITTGMLMNWKALVDTYVKPKLPTSHALDKFIILVPHDVDAPGVKGIANDIGGQYGIASITNERVAGHEVGHLLGATHEDGGIIYDGWLKPSLMVATPDSALPEMTSYRFSDKNRHNIKEYLNRLD